LNVRLLVRVDIGIEHCMLLIIVELAPLQYVNS
jgi:hypothetical protein